LNLKGTDLWRKRTAVMYILYISFFVVVFTCICQAILIILQDFKWGIESFQDNLGFTFAIFVFPVLFSVIIFNYLLKKYILFKNSALNISLRFLFLFFIIQSALICWALLDLQFFDFDYEYTYQNILKAYKENYLDFLPVSFLIPVPILYLDRRYHNRNNAVIPGNEMGVEK